MAGLGDQEDDYRALYAEEDRSQLRLVIGIFSAVTLTFLAFDADLLRRSPDPWLLVTLGLRIVLALYSAVLWFGWLGRVRPHRTTDRLAAVWVALGVLMILANALSRPRDYYGHYLFEVLAILLFFGSMPLPTRTKTVTGLLYLAGALPLVLWFKQPSFALSTPNAVLALVSATLVGVLLARRIERYRRQSHAARRELERLSQTDPLTGLANRRAFWSWASGFLRDEAPRLALLAADLDRFKAVNDRYGHETGDRVLKTFADRVSAVLRQEDRLARIGGEEFCIGLPGCGPEEALTAARRIVDEVSAQPFDTPAGPLRITVSVGTAQWAPGDQTLEDTLRRADEALYRAKQNGRNRAES